ncbi:MAG: hypothetical protein M3Q79_04065 [bacterium]|nr:hypothetical protein [bacterium]
MDTSEKSIKLVNSFVVRSRLYKILSRLILILLLPLMFYIVTIININAPEKWSLKQLWISIREGYFFEDPLLYVTQQTYPHFDDDTKMATLIGMVIFVAVLMLIYTALLTRLRVVFARGKNIKHMDIPGSVFSQLSHKNKFYSQSLNVGGKTIEIIYRSDIVLLITNLSASLPHTIIESSGRRSTSFLKNLSGRLAKETELVVDGISKQYFRFFCATQDYAQAYELLNLDFVADLVKGTRAADIEIKDDTLIVVYDIYELKHNNEIQGAVNEVVSLTKSLESNLANRDDLNNELLKQKFELKPLGILHSGTTKIVIFALLAIIYGLITGLNINSYKEFVFYTAVFAYAELFAIYKFYVRDVI